MTHKLYLQFLFYPADNLFEFVQVEKLKGEKELNSIIVYGKESSKQAEHAEEDDNSLKDEYKVHACL